MVSDAQDERRKNKLLRNNLRGALKVPTVNRYILTFN